MVILTDDGRYNRQKMWYKMNKRVVFIALCSFYKKKHTNYEENLFAYLMIKLITEA